MMQMIEMPGPENNFQAKHTDLLISSFHYWTGRVLLQKRSSAEDYSRDLFEAPFGLVSHNTEDDPVFNYGNQTALKLFELEWPEFTNLPSRRSAEPVDRAERERIMQRVTLEGYIDDYRGVRISSSGKKFMIEDATVWNIIDNAGVYHGQAAVFHRWTKL